MKLSKEDRAKGFFAIANGLHMNTFRHKDVEVVETVFKDGDRLIVAWCKPPFEMTDIPTEDGNDSVPNPLFHESCPFIEGWDTQEHPPLTMARIRCRDKFDQHYKLPTLFQGMCLCHVCFETNATMRNETYKKEKK